PDRRRGRRARAGRAGSSLRSRARGATTSGARSHEPGDREDALPLGAHRRDTPGAHHAEASADDPRRACPLRARARPARRVVSRAVIIVPLRKGTRDRATELLSGGPPFDPKSVGLERHQVFLSDVEAVFVFEADSREAAEKLIGEERFWSAGSAW